MGQITQAQVIGAIRTLLVCAGGIVIDRGYAPAKEVTEVIGALMVILPYAWSAWDKAQVEKKAASRETTAVNATLAQVADAQGIPPTSAPVVTHDEAQAIIKNFTAGAK